MPRSAVRPQAVQDQRPALEPRKDSSVNTAAVHATPYAIARTIWSAEKPRGNPEGRGRRFQPNHTRTPSAPALPMEITPLASAAPRVTVPDDNVTAVQSAKKGSQAATAIRHRRIVIRPIGRPDYSDLAAAEAAFTDESGPFT